MRLAQRLQLLRVQVVGLGGGGARVPQPLVHELPLYAEDGPHGAPRDLEQLVRGRVRGRVGLGWVRVTVRVRVRVRVGVRVRVRVGVRVG